jgi:hypothetical protein
MAETLRYESLVERLADPNFKTILFLGPEGDDGWLLARAAEANLPGVRAYLVGAHPDDDPPTPAQVRAAFSMPRGHLGVVVNREGDEYFTLSAAESRDFLTLVETVAELN